ncbi:MAG: glycosyltransferase family 117 protein [Gemmatimonadaceae bacterium]
MSSGSSRVRPDAAAAAFLFAVYGATIAHGVTFWDAGEFLSAVHSLGIPHPPGTPLFVLLARVWSMLLAPVLGFTLAVNAFSAFCTAVAFGLVANMFWHWTRDALASFCAAATAGLMSTVWLNATETEVYACALLASMLILWSASRAASSGEMRWLVLVAYVCGLGWSLHLTALLSVPAAIVLLWPLRRALLSRYSPAVPAVFLIGASAVLFMLLRAAHDPAINQGNPVTLAALSDAVQRHQYDVAPMWPRRAPLWLQVGNVFEYADWQFALGLAPDPPPGLLRTPFTVLYAALGVYGSIAHRRKDRASWRAWLAFLLTTSIGVVLYLNLRAGASYGVGVLPSNALHEARDRDYFFTWAFVAWGAWAGSGAVMAARNATGSIARATPARRSTVALAILVALLPCALNWRLIVAERRDEHDAERQARRMLASVPRNGVFLAIGDNDTYPLWYMQEVQSFRRDVVIVTVPLLPPTWYRAELRRRHQLIDATFVTSWFGIPATVADVRRRAQAQGRAVIESPLLSKR